jgi:hypothetical protein
LFFKTKIIFNKKDNSMTLKRPVALWFLVFWMLFLAIGGFYGGITMLIDPSGRLLQMTDILPFLPVSDFVLPGLFLLFVMGLLPLALIYALLARPNWQRLESLFSRMKFYWAWIGTLILVVILAIWLATEGVLIGFKWAIQYVTAIIGLFILLFALLPSIRKFYRK